MRSRILFIVPIVALVVALAWQQISMRSEIKRLEKDLQAMDTYLKQFAVPIEDLRRDVGEIYVELERFDSIARAPGLDGNAAPEPTRSAPRVEQPVAMPLPVVPAGPVYYGNYDDYDAGVASQPPKGHSFAGAIDEEDD